MQTYQINLVYKIIFKKILKIFLLVYICDMKNGFDQIPPTEEEKQIVLLLASGKESYKVAEELGVNKNTFAFRLKVLRSFYGCKNSAQLIALFLRNKFID